MKDVAALARGVIALGFSGTEPADAPLEELRAFAPGGIVLFARNVATVASLRDLVASLRALGAPPPLIAIDQEGGRVARIREGVAPLPPAMALGATGDPALVERLGLLLARDLARLGISVDFAPVADLALEAKSTVIGTRAYGDDPARVAPLASAFARGLERGGVAATLKHFPGHGATAVDSHLSLPRVTIDAATLRARDLVPFARAIEEGRASIVMTAHVVVEAFDREHPATLSPRVIRGLLRDELGFDGVVCTDCLEMEAIAGGVGVAEAAVRALDAGADLLVISHRLDRAQEAADAIGAAVRDGRLARERLEQAHARISALRERLAASQAPPEPVDEDSPLDAARRAVTVVRGDPRLRTGKAVTVVSFEGTLADNAALSGTAAGTIEAPSLSAALRRRRWKSEILRVPLAPDPDDLDLLLEQIARLGDREFVVVTRRAHLEPAQRDAVARILALVPGALIVSAREPFDALLWPEAKRVVCIYGDESLSFDGCADVLSGRADARGVLPVRLVETTAVR
jgi:beta-N-acetylhexosaminidase